MKPIVEIKRVNGYVPVVDEKKQVLDAIIYRREGEDTWNTLETEEYPMSLEDDKEKKRSDFWFQASEMLFESQKDVVDENAVLKQENEKLHSALECIAELCSESESLDAVGLIKDIHRIAIEVHKNIKNI